MVNQLKHNPNLRKELEELGYLDEQIPGWVARPLDIPKGAPEELILAGTLLLQ